MKDRTLLCAVILGVLLGAAFFLSAWAVFGEPYPWVPGEYKNVWINVSERDGGTFTIDTATSWINHTDGTLFSAETSAIVDGSSVYAPVDGTAWLAQSSYILYIKWGTDLTEEIYINAIEIQVEEGI